MQEKFIMILVFVMFLLASLSNILFLFYFFRIKRTEEFYICV
jgi:hypothetical protein